MDLASSKAVELRLVKSPIILPSSRASSISRQVSLYWLRLCLLWPNYALVFSIEWWLIWLASSTSLMHAFGTQGQLLVKHFFPADLTPESFVVKVWGPLGLLAQILFQAAWTFELLVDEFVPVRINDLWSFWDLITLNLGSFWFPVRKTAHACLWVVLCHAEIWLLLSEICWCVMGVLACGS